MLASHQSGFREGRGASDPVVCLEDELRKVQVKNKTVVAVFFDVEKACDILLKESLIKMYLMEIGGIIFNIDFLNGRNIKVKIESVISRKCVVEKET